MNLRRNSALALVLMTICGAAIAGAPPDVPVSAREASLAGLSADVITTGIFYDSVVPLSEIDDYDGSFESPSIGLKHWRQIYHEIYRASLDEPSWPEIGCIRELARRKAADGVIPIAFMDFRYNRVRPETLGRGFSTPPASGLAGIDADQILDRRVFAATALKDYTYRGADTEFSLGPDLCFTNGRIVPAAISIDFDDGLGFRAIDAAGRCHVSYTHPGKMSVRVRADFDGGTTLWAGFGFDVRQLQIPTPDDTLAISASIPYLGEYGTGEAYVYYGESHASLSNPVLVIEGFDLDNTMNWEELYADLNQEGLIETLRTRGYDAVVLNFTEATDYIQRNSFVVVELIQQVNSLVHPGADLAVIGASMGGLCGRYALAYMEDQALDHNTRTFISFDVPHRGANIPLGIQYWVRLFSIESEDAAFLLERLSTPASKQMLVYFYTDPPGATGESDPLFADFFTDLASIGGHPAGLRKVAVANGSGHMADQGFAPGEQIIFYEYNSFLVDIVGNVWAVSDNTYHIIFDGLINRIWPFPDDHLVAYVDGTKPYDSAPGGFRSTMAQMDSTEAPYGDIIALHDSHCFIPTISALDLDTDDLFYDMANDPDILAHTPFDTVYYPVANEGHITITAESKNWFIDELGRGVLAGADGIAAPAPGPVLERSGPNPFRSETSFRFSVPQARYARLEIYDVTGRRVAELVDGAVKPGWNQATWDGNNDDGESLSSGVYFGVLVTGSARLSRRVVLLR